MPADSPVPALPPLAPEALAPAVPPVAADSAGHYEQLLQRLAKQKDALLNSLCSVDIYIELAALVLAVLVAKLAASFIRKRIRTALTKRPVAHIDIDFVTKPLALLSGLLAFFFFTAEKITFELLDIQTDWIDAALKLCVAYMMARAVLLVVHTKPVARFIAWVIMIVAVLKAVRVMRSVNAYLESLAFDLGNFHISALGVLNGLVVLVVVFWGATALSLALESYLRRISTLSYNAREIIVKCFKLFTYFVALFVTLSAMGVDLTAFAVFGGALGVGVGLGLQKLTSNFVSSVTLLMEKSIRINDLVEVAGFTGWVRKLNTRYALIETSDGREVMIPNEVMVSSNLTNWTHTTTQALIEVKVTVDYGADAAKAHSLILAAAIENPLCLKDPAPSCFLKEFKDNGIMFVLSFWIADIRKGRSAPQSEVMFAILRKFSEAGIRMAPPAQEAAKV